MPNTIAVIETNEGTFEIKLMPDIAPKACENYVGHINNGYYDNVIFHRVIKKFMIQGGDPTGTGRGGESIWGESFVDEGSMDITFDRKGLLAMANAGPNSNGSQFFITTAPAPWLHMKHTIFGEVVLGYEVIEEIEHSKTDGDDRPEEDKKIVKASIKKT